jgi:hypothetical protein
MKNIETPDKAHLSSIVEDLKDGSFVIPDFQREMEWEPWDIVDLLRSIFMDYYIGTLLFWKAGNQNIKKLKCEPIRGYEGQGKPEHIVLDGQQRLSALYYAFFAPNIEYPRRKKRCLFFVKLEELLNENFEEAFYYDWETRKIKNLIAKEEIQYKKKIMPLHIIGKDRYGFIDWIRGYKKYWEEHSENSEESRRESDNIENIFRELLDKYYISYIELDRDIPIAKVCDIFTKINSTGIPLSIFDLLNAILRPQDIFLKEMWNDISEILEYTDPKKMKVYILQVMSILKQAYCSPKYLYYLVPEEKKLIKNPDGSKKHIVLIKDREEFLLKWNESVDIIKRTIKAMKNPRDFGAINPNYVPYPSIIPPLAAIRRYVELNDLEGKARINQKIRLWYWASIFTKNYSSSVESQSARDFNLLIKWFEDDEEEPEIVTQFKNDYSSLDLKRETRQGSAIYNAIFNILILKGARDWSTFNLPEYSELDGHHIIPNFWGKDKVGDDINSILNKTPLSAETNRNVINKKLPNEYLKKMINENGEDKIYELMESHFISKKAVDILLREDFSKEDFYEFIEERRKSIINGIKNIIIETDSEKNVNYLDLINEDEGENLEFKATFKYDLKEEKPNKDRKFDVMKAITAFLNTNGGKVIVGVIDETREIFGLEKDYECCFKGSKDGFLQEFDSTLHSFFDERIIRNYIKWKITKLKNDKEILEIDVQKSNEGIFTKKNQEKVLFVRRGNKTVPLTDPEIIHKYISDNW